MAYAEEGSTPTPSPLGGWPSFNSDSAPELFDWRYLDEMSEESTLRESPQHSPEVEVAQLSESPLPIPEAIADMGFGDLDTWVAESEQFLAFGQSLLESANSLPGSGAPTHHGVQMEDYIDLTETLDNVGPLSPLEQFALIATNRSSTLDAMAALMGDDHNQHQPEQAQQPEVIDLEDHLFGMDWDNMGVDEIDSPTMRALTAELGIDPNIPLDFDEAFAEIAEMLNFDPTQEVDSPMTVEELSALLDAEITSPQREMRNQLQSSVRGQMSNRGEPFGASGLQSLVPPPLFSQPRSSPFTPPTTYTSLAAHPIRHQPPANFTPDPGVVLGSPTPVHLGGGAVGLSVPQGPFPLFQPRQMVPMPMPLPNNGRFTFTYPAPGIQPIFRANGGTSTLTDAAPATTTTGAQRKREWRKASTHRERENQQARARVNSRRRQAKADSRAACAGAAGARESPTPSPPLLPSPPSSGGVSGDVRARHANTVSPPATTTSSQSSGGSWYRMTSGGRTVGYFHEFSPPVQIQPVVVDPRHIDDRARDHYRRSRSLSPESPVRSSSFLRRSTRQRRPNSRHR